MRDRDAKRLSAELGISYVHARRLVQRARSIAKQEQISYHAALARVLGEREPSAAQSLRQCIEDAVEAACIDMAYSEVDYLHDERPGGSGLDFGDVPLPTSIVENIAVEVVEPQLETLKWQIGQEYDGRTQTADVELTANVIFDGYIHKSTAYGLSSSDISVIDIDWNDHMARASFSRPVKLVFHAVLHPDLPSVDNVEFAEASPAYRAESAHYE